MAINYISVFYPLKCIVNKDLFILNKWNSKKDKKKLY